MNFDNLAQSHAELVNLIFSYVDNSGLIISGLICKSWRKIIARSHKECKLLDRKICYHATIDNHLNLFIWALMQGAKCTSKIYIIIAECGRLDILKFILSCSDEIACPMNNEHSQLRFNKYDDFGNIALIASKFRNYDIVEWIIENQLTKEETTEYERFGHVQSGDQQLILLIADNMALNGDFEEFKCFTKSFHLVSGWHGNGVNITTYKQFLGCAVMGGNIKLVKYILKDESMIDRSQYRYMAFYVGCSGNIDILKLYLKKIRCAGYIIPWNVICQGALQFGNIELAKHLSPQLNYNASSGILGSKTLIHSAIIGGCSDSLIWLSENHSGFYLNVKDHKDILDYVIIARDQNYEKQTTMNKKNIIERRFNNLKYMTAYIKKHELNISDYWTNGMIDNIIIDGHFAIIQWLHEQGYEFNMDHLHNAISFEHANISKFLCSIIDRSEWWDKVCGIAANSDNVKLLKLFRSMGCPWNLNEYNPIKDIYNNTKVEEWLSSSNIYFRIMR